MEPYLSLLRESGAGKLLLEDEDGLGGDYLTGVVADGSWAREHELIVIAYLKAHLRAHQLIRHEFDRVVIILHLATGFPVPVIHRVMSRVTVGCSDLYTRSAHTGASGKSVPGAIR